MDTFPPTPSALLTFPQASLSHHLGSHSFPLSSGPCSLVELEGGQLALTIPPKTSVVIGKENLVRKTDQNQAHCTYSFNYAPTSGASATASSSADGLLPSNNQEAGGYLKLTLPESKNSDQYDATSLLSRQFESLLLAHSPPLLDTRIAPVVADDQEETITAVLSSWWFDGLKGLKDTAGVVYTGVKEQAGGLYGRGAAVVGGGEAVGEASVPGGAGAKKTPGQEEEGEALEEVGLNSTPTTKSTAAFPSTNAAVLHAEEAV